jgi:hypothetical protein
MKARIIAVHCPSVTLEERTQTLRTCVKSMVNTQTYINVLEVVKNYDFPDAAYLYCSWAIHLHQQQKLQEAMNVAMVACKFNYATHTTHHCDTKFSEYYSYLRYHLVGYYGFAVKDYLNGLYGAEKACIAKPNDIDARNVVLYKTVPLEQGPTKQVTFWVCVPLFNRHDDVTKLLHNLLGTSVSTLFTIKIVIADFNSTDIDFDKVLSQYTSGLVTIIKMAGTFNIAKALQACPKSGIL